MTSFQGTSFKPKALSKVLKKHFNKEQLGEFASLDVSGVSLDSRAISEGVMFIAYPGHQSDGRQYLQQAVDAGASALVVEKEDLEKFATVKSDVAEFSGAPLIAIENLAQASGDIAARFYGNPTRKMSVTGITGTNGKTSC